MFKVHLFLSAIYLVYTIYLFVELFNVDGSVVITLPNRIVPGEPRLDFLMSRVVLHVNMVLLLLLITMFNLFIHAASAVDMVKNMELWWVEHVNVLLIMFLTMVVAGLRDAMLLLVLCTLVWVMIDQLVMNQFRMVRLVVPFLVIWLVILSAESLFVWIMYILFVCYYAIKYYYLVWLSRRPKGFELLVLLLLITTLLVYIKM